MAQAAAETSDRTTTAPAFRMLPISNLRSSTLNPRKHFDPVKLQELADTMGNNVGVIEPLVVRDHGGAAPGRFEIVAGDRRWRAAKLAKLDEVPVVIKALSDPQVLEIMVIENDQREDINPLEEGDGFKRLMTFGFDIDKLAGRIGRSRKYIYDRVKLLELVPEAKTILLDRRITAGHAILLARLQPVQQRKAISVPKTRWGHSEGPLFQHETGLFTPDDRRNGAKKDPYAGLKTCSVRELEAWIDQHCRFDASAPVNVELFPETAKAVEEAKKVVFITYDHHTHPDAKDGNTKRIYSVVSWRRADGERKSRTCTKSVTGVIVAGFGRGEALEVCVNKECDIHWGKEKRAKARAAGSSGAVARYAQRQAAQDAKWKKEREQREAREALFKKGLPVVLAAVADKVRSIAIAAVGKELLAQRHRADVAQAIRLLPRATGSGPENTLRLLLLADLVGHTSPWNQDRFTNRVKALLGVDVKAVLKKVQTSAQAGATTGKTTKAKAARGKRTAAKR